MDAIISEVLSSTGTAKQRAEAKARGPKVRASLLADRLFELWAQGSMTTPTMQYIAEAVVSDHPDCHPDIIKLSRLGTSGLYQGNIYRDFKRTFKVQNDFVEATMIELPILNKNVRLKRFHGLF